MRIRTNTAPFLCRLPQAATCLGLLPKKFPVHYNVFLHRPTRSGLTSTPIFFSSFANSQGFFRELNTMSRGGGTTLYVTGFGHGTRARDLAYEFERYAIPLYTLPSSSRPFSTSLSWAFCLSYYLVLFPLNSHRTHSTHCNIALTFYLATADSSAATFLPLVLPPAASLPLSNTRAVAMPMTPTTRCTTSALDATMF